MSLTSEEKKACRKVYKHICKKDDFEDWHLVDLIRKYPQAFPVEFLYLLKSFPDFIEDALGLDQDMDYFMRSDIDNDTICLGLILDCLLDVEPKKYNTIKRMRRHLAHNDLRHDVLSDKQVEMFIELCKIIDKVENVNTTTCHWCNQSVDVDAAVYYATKLVNDYELPVSFCQKCKDPLLAYDPQAKFYNL